MMVLSVLRPEASLPEFLAHRARAASLRRLSLDVVAGLGALSALLLWRPSGLLVLGSAVLFFALYGAWGITDRARSAPAATGDKRVMIALNVICGMLAAGGVLAMAALFFGVWSIALGTWIS
jgi:hypothetical protein